MGFPQEISSDLIKPLNQKVKMGMLSIVSFVGSMINQRSLVERLEAPCQQADIIPAGWNIHPLSIPALVD